MYMIFSVFIIILRNVNLIFGKIYFIICHNIWYIEYFDLYVCRILRLGESIKILIIYFVYILVFVE